MNNPLYISLLTLLIIAHGQSFSSDVHGTIISNKEPLAGVLVYVVNNKDNFYVSDSLGTYTIRDVEDNDSIVFSFLGFKELIRPVLDLKQNGKVIMTEDTKSLDEVFIFRNKEFSSDFPMKSYSCLLYTSDAADDLLTV